jgi:hypothetical protein
MRKRTGVWVAVVVMILVGAARWVSAARADSEVELSAGETEAAQRGVAAALATYRELAASGKWSDVALLYADDPRFRWWTNGAVEARSVADIRKGLLSLPAGTRVENTYREPEILVLARGVVLVSCAFETKVSDAQGAGYGFGGWITMTFIERDGAWRILNGHVSSPLPRRGA